MGNKIKKMRIEMGLSQRDLACRCNMQPSHIGQIERGEKSPTLDTLKKLAAGFGISVSQLTDIESLTAPENDQTTNKIVSVLCRLDENQKSQILSIVKTFADK